MAFTVGQLAKLTGLTVRALHHYDAIGLLVPSHRSDAGYRLYTQADTARLFQIQSLRRLGLSLTEIHDVLTKNGAPLPEIVSQQIEELSDRIEQTTALRARLLQLGELLANGAEPGAGDWVSAVELITHYDEYYSSEEMNRLLAHERTGVDEWPALIADVRAAMARGVAPDSEEAQSLSNRWRELMMRSVAGDTSLAIKMKLAYFERPEVRARVQTRSGLDAAVTEYVTEIWRHQHLALWTRHLGYDDARRLHLPDDRMREWLRIVAEMRDAMKAGDGPTSDGVQRLLCQSEALLDEFSSGDSELKRRMWDAFNVDRDLQSGWALDGDVLTFVAGAREHASIQGARIG